jgi:hypothetical protein
MLIKSALAAILGVALLAPVPALALQNPSLGELALKEQERRKGLKASGAGRVVTNGDVPRGAVQAPPVPGAAAPATAKGDDKTAKPEEPSRPDDPAKPDNPPKNEAWWKMRMSQEREALRRNEMFAAALQTRINSLTNDFTSRDDPYQRAQISEERVKTVHELERVATEVELARKKMADIEEEARKAGVPPGWLR